MAQEMATSETVLKDGFEFDASECVWCRRPESDHYAPNGTPLACDLKARILELEAALRAVHEAFTVVEVHLACGPGYAGYVSKPVRHALCAFQVELMRIGGRFRLR